MVTRGRGRFAGSLGSRRRRLGRGCGKVWDGGRGLICSKVLVMGKLVLLGTDVARRDVVRDVILRLRNRRRHSRLTIEDGHGDAERRDVVQCFEGGIQRGQRQQGQWARRA